MTDRCHLFSYSWLSGLISNIPPQADGPVGDKQLVPQELKMLRMNTFGEDVGYIILSRNVMNREVFAKYLFPDEVVMNFNMLGASMKDRI